MSQPCKKLPTQANVTREVESLDDLKLVDRLHAVYVLSIIVNGICWVPKLLLTLLAVSIHLKARDMSFLKVDRPAY